MSVTIKLVSLLYILFFPSLRHLQRFIMYFLFLFHNQIIRAESMMHLELYLAMTRSVFHLKVHSSEDFIENFGEYTIELDFSS